jgi:hypothetical protein
MEEIYPSKNVQDKFESDVRVDYYFLKDIDTIAELEPDSLSEIGGNAWMNYVESGAKVIKRQSP